MELGLTILALAASVTVLWLWWRLREEKASLLRRLDRAEAGQAAAEAQQREAETQAQAQQAALIRSMGEGVLVLDGDGRIQLSNPAFDRLFGVKADLHGRRVLEALRSHELDELVRRTFESGPVVGAELEVRGSEPCVVEVNAAPIAGGREPGMVLVFHDLTRIRQLENTRKEFVANVSHELRTPLSIIKGYVETLIGGAKDDPAIAPRFLQIIARHTDRLTYLIEDLLTISQLESGAAALNLQPVGLRDLAARTIEDLTLPAGARKIRIVNEVPADLIARADGDRVQQVLFNLVDNAIKYGRPEGVVTVGGREASDERVEMSVRDNGPGIPPEAQQRIFERFYRVDKVRSREEGGTGLGLAIVKHIVQSHGGEVRLESAPGTGAAFYFTLPRG